MGCKSAFLDYTCCDLVVKLKECKKQEDLLATPGPSPAMPSPTAAEEPGSSDPLEGSSEPRHLLASSMTLQVKKPSAPPHPAGLHPSGDFSWECGLRLASFLPVTASLSVCVTGSSLTLCHLSSADCLLVTATQVTLPGKNEELWVPAIMTIARKDCLEVTWLTSYLIFKRSLSDESPYIPHSQVRVHSL